MSRPIRESLLVLTDGTVFEGEALGAAPAAGVATGEVVFNTVMAGYQEVLSDPSYAGQIVTFTYPHIGNYGATPVDDEYRRPFCRGVIVRELARRRSNWRSDEDLNAWLVRNGVPGIGVRMCTTNAARMKPVRFLFLISVRPEAPTILSVRKAQTTIKIVLTQFS